MSTTITQSREEANKRQPVLSNVLLQLEENERMRVQTYLLSNAFQQQQASFLSWQRSQRMQLQKITAQLRFFLKNHQSQQSCEPAPETIISLILNCILDLQALTQSSPPKITANIGQTQGQQLKESQNRLIKLWTAKLSEADYVINEILRDKKMVEMRLQAAECELSKWIERGQSCEKLEQVEKQFCLLNRRLNALSDQNQQLVNRLKQTQQIHGKHVEYLRKKTDQVQLENKQMMLLHRQAASRESDLIKMLEEKDKSICRLTEEGKKVRKQLQGYQIKVRQLIGQEEKIRILKDERIKRTPAQPLTEIKNIQNCQSLGQQIQSSSRRKFRLQAFQEKVSTSNVSN